MLIRARPEAEPYPESPFCAFASPSTAIRLIGSFASEIRCSCVRYCAPYGQPGSPLSSPSALAPGTLAWDFNYRGPRTFLEQARQAGVAWEDGWDYFLAGWSAALAAIGGTQLTADVFESIKDASATLR